MNFSEIFLDALKYPTKNYLKLVILGILCFIPVIPMLCISVLYGPNNISLDGLVIGLGLLSAVLFLVIYLFIFGYLFSIVKNTVENNDGYPEFKFLDNFVDGIKLVIIQFVYFIIPSIISFILVIVFVGLNMDALSLLTSNLNNNTLNNAANISAFLSSNMGLIIPILVFLVISVIIFALFTLLSIIAIGRFAKTENFGSAFQIKEVYNKIASIGIIRYIGLIVVMDIIVIIVACISDIFNMVPYIGIIISSIIIDPYIYIFGFRVMGLIYNEGESEAITEPIEFTD
ncbi:MAG: DUF4013 domain-containing protein [Methanobrevibacter sp.]|jgi:hypothetical protein|nr:DUF4013 domain-containing protein [Candidatus Methanovirga australis]